MPVITHIWPILYVPAIVPAMPCALKINYCPFQPTLRRLINLTGYTPLPSDAMVTPVTFPIRKRNLRGVLSEMDAAEGGTRELSGEWVVGRKLWKQLQAEWKASKSPKDGKTPPSPPRRKDRVILYLHGGMSKHTHSVLSLCY